MWKKFAGWYRRHDNEALLLLQNPETAAQASSRWQRWVASRVLTLTPIERQQFHAFMLKYRGVGFYVVLAKLMLLFSMIGGALHLIFPDKLGWIKALVVSNGIGLAMAWGVLGVWFNYRKLASKKRTKRTKGKLLALLLVPALAGGAIGVARAMLEGNSPLAAALESGARVGGWAALTSGLVYLVPMTIVAIWRNRQYEALTVQLQQDAERDRLARELSESQLRLLRAQIEPHFLFNTLGAVQQLAEQGAPRAAALTSDLIAFLRASLAEMRSEHVALHSEFEMVAAYLRVMQARLGSRLRFSLDLPAELAQATIPSMILLTLAENAIKHGIEPSLRGGEIGMSAALAGDGRLRLRVHDSGMGLPEGGAGSAPGGGLGLENVRSRLLLSDPFASLVLCGGEEGGVIAEIVLPFKTDKNPMENHA